MLCNRILQILIEYFSFINDATQSFKHRDVSLLRFDHLIQPIAITIAFPLMFKGNAYKFR